MWRKPRSVQRATSPPNFTLEDDGPDQTVAQRIWTDLDRPRDSLVTCLIIFYWLKDSMRWSLVKREA
jgi:hypothetical protein